MVQSGVDKMVDPFQAIDFEKQCNSKDKTVVYFKDMWHGIFLEEELPQVIQVVREWLAQRINK
jgi:alpha-beta hydrolase superfamily lysophospholipase